MLNYQRVPIYIYIYTYLTYTELGGHPNSSPLIQYIPQGLLVFTMICRREIATFWRWGDAAQNPGSSGSIPPVDNGNINKQSWIPQLSNYFLDEQLFVIFCAGAASSDPHPLTFYLTYSDIPSGILFGILSDIYIYIYSDILSGICSGPCVPNCIRSSR